jgi:hypothetical protein
MVQKRILHKILCGAALAAVLFAVPVTASSNPLNVTWNNHILPPSLNTPPDRTWNSSMLSDRPLTRRQEGLDIRGRIPDISGSFVSAHFLNDHISNNLVTSLVGEARRLRARSVSFRYEYHPTEDVISIVIFADVATTLPHTLVRSVNFCPENGTLLSVNQATSMDIMSLAERFLSEKIRSNPERYYAALAAPFSAQTYYLSNGRLVIMFDGFRLSTRVGEIETIEINLNNVRTVILSPENYRTDGPYGLKMIPLRTMLEWHLDYEVYWCDWTHMVVVSRNGMNIIELRPDDNDYIVLGTQRRSLEAAPQIIEGNMYVPITFFDQILPLTTYAIGFDGSIRFLSYLE